MIFVDSSYFVAAFWAEDGHWEAATRLTDAYAGDRLVTTSHVRGEMWTVMQRRAGHAAAAEWVEELSRSRFEVFHIDQQTEHAALRWLRHHPEREYSFVDATSFAFMRERAIEHALTFDEDFEAAGFELLRP